MPLEQCLRCYDGGKLGEQAHPQGFGLSRQATPLVVTEPESPI